MKRAIIQRLPAKVQKRLKFAGLYTRNRRRPNHGRALPTDSPRFRCRNGLLRAVVRLHKMQR